jgi:2-succinyl-5-enolpyruvyl-6-hydroxy-3-cyclohexene-1-carboxylate synthase
VRCGDLPTSKPLRAWLDGLGEDVTQLGFDPHGTWQDPGASLQVVLAACAAQTLATAAAHTPTADPDWLRGWRDADAAAAAAIDAVLGDSALSEPLTARALAAALPADATLFVASSMPVRDVEAFTAVRDDGPRVLCNRGANGIDGTVSSAFGAAAVSSGPVVLLIGDVALAHDVGGLLAARRLDLAITIVLLDNDGGGIFEFLPLAGARDIFEQHVATPHGLDFAHAAQLYGCAFEDVSDLAGLHAALTAALRADTTTIVRVGSDRAANLALHRELSAAVAATLTA